MCPRLCIHDLSYKRGSNLPFCPYCILLTFLLRPSTPHSVEPESSSSPNTQDTGHYHSNCPANIPIPIVSVYAVLRRISFRSLRTRSAPESAACRYPEAAHVASLPAWLSYSAFQSSFEEAAERNNALATWQEGERVSTSMSQSLEWYLTSTQMDEAVDNTWTGDISFVISLSVQTWVLWGMKR